MKKNIILLLFILFGFTSNAKNQIAIKPENTIFNKVLKQLNLKISDVQESLFVEKIIPYNKSLTIMVIPKIETKQIDESNNYYEFGLYVVVVDNKNGVIKSKFYESGSLTSDAVVLSGIEIDTAHYDINTGQRAFGIRFNYSGSSGPNPYNKTELSLFFADNKNLKRILNNYSVAEFNGEWDMNCAGEFQEKESTLQFDNRILKFNNLLVKQKITNQVNEKIKDSCVEKKSIKNKKLFLKYSNTTQSYN